MPLPNSGPISIQQINAEFGLGNNLGAYRGVRWFKSDNSRGFFPSGANAFMSMSLFRGTRPTSPVVAGSQTYNPGTTSITLPALFNTLTVEVYAGGGGGGGGGYLKAYTEVYGGASGGSGGNTTFGNSGDVYFLSCTGGSGGGGGTAVTTNALGGKPEDGTGSAGTNGTPSTGGGAGGSNGLGIGSFSNGRNDIFALVRVGAPGGNGGLGGSNSKLVFDINQIGFDAIKQYYGISVPVSIGTGGAGGLGGNQGGTFAFSGSSGGNGRIVVSWT